MSFPYVFPFLFTTASGTVGSGGTGTVASQGTPRHEYERWQPTLGPSWLQGPYGELWLAAHGALKDVLVDRIRQSAKVDMPTAAPPDAVAALGLERSLERGPTETDAAYALRVRAAWDTWQWAGTAYGVLGALAVQGYPNVVVAQVNRRMFWLDSSGALVVTHLSPGSWAIDATPTFWSKFQLIFPAPLPTAWLAGGLTSVFHGGTGTGTITATGTPLGDYRFAVKIVAGGAVGAGTYKWTSNYGATWSSTVTLAAGPTALGATGVSFSASGTFVTGDLYAWAPTFNVPGNTSDEVERIRRVVKKWQPGHATNAGYVVVTRGSLVGYPPATVGTANLGYVGTSTVTTWSA